MKDILTSPRVKDMNRKRRVRRVRLMVLTSILIISLFAALAYFSSNPHVTITKVVVTGTRIINPTEVEKHARNSLSGRYIRLFAKSNTIIYPHDEIHNKLIMSFPRIEKLSVYRDNWQTLHIKIEERSGSSLYCGDRVPEDPANIGENCYFVNNDGYVFDKAPYFSGAVYFKYYIPLKNPEVLGQQILPPNKFHAIVRFIDGITSLGFKPLHLIAGSEGEMALFLSSRSSDTGPRIIFNDENDLEVILDNLSLAMSKPAFANEINSKYTSLQYIDLRFNNKVLYKFE